jgi:uncharacterized protein GlcG (DUF336 family)
LAGVTQKQAEGWISKAQKKAEELNIKVSIFVVDASGIPVAFTKMDGAGIMTPDFAKAKAFTAVAFQRNTKDAAEAMKERVLFGASLLEVGAGKTMIAPGGVIAKSDSELLGAVGVSGGTADQDHDCATQAIS